MKIYICKICEKRKKSFSGIRPLVRKHLREEHLVKPAPKSTNPKQTRDASPITSNCIAISFSELELGFYNNLPPPQG